MKKVLILEPYYGGSHKFFLDGLQNNISSEYTLFTLPARKWKMRMQLSAPWFIKKIEELPRHKRRFDVVLCSTFVDVSVLRALLTQVDGWDQQAKMLTFFHENQFAYPQRNPKQNDFQFTAINFNTGLASDKIGFNSNYNRSSFLAGCRKFLQSASDMKREELVDDLEEKSTLLYPGIDFTECDQVKQSWDREVPVIVWNHRWEHDKNPDQFFEALLQLEKKGRDFHLILLGQSFQSCPKCFVTAQQHFGKKVLHYGFAESYSHYISLLKQGDIVISTSLHEFYGIAIIEAVRSGCFPVLPEKLSYPELFDSPYLYGENGLVKKLDALLQKDDIRLSAEKAIELTEKFSWSSLRSKYHDWLFAP